MKKVLFAIFVCVCLCCFYGCGSDTTAGANEGVGVEDFVPYVSNQHSVQTSPFPPTYPIEGSAYINSGSGYLCYWECSVRAGREACGWAWDSKGYNPSYIGTHNDLPACKAFNRVGIKPVITLIETSHPNKVVDVNLCGSGSCYFDINVDDADEVLARDFPVKAIVYAIKLSDDPTYPFTTLDLTQVPGARLSMYENIYKSAINTPNHHIPNTPNLRVAVQKSGEGTNASGTWYARLDYPFVSIEFTQGVWGFVCSVVDADHNVVDSDLLPMMIKYTDKF